jgi:Phage integrase, N-terminal SAM-like domain
MQQLPPEITASFQLRLHQAHVPLNLHLDYHKWAAFFIYFCHKYGFPPTAPTALGPFLTKLAAKGYTIAQRHHAASAVKLMVRPDPKDPSLYHQLSSSSPHPDTTGPSAIQGLAEACPSAPGRPVPVDSPPAERTSWEREFHDLESAIKLRNYSSRTLEAYRFWVARFQAFVRSRPTAKLSNQQVRGFLSFLAVKQTASASSQNQAFNALLFFFRQPNSKSLRPTTAVALPLRRSGANTSQPLEPAGMERSVYGLRDARSVWSAASLLPLFLRPAAPKSPASCCTLHACFKQRRMVARRRNSSVRSAMFIVSNPFSGSNSSIGATCPRGPSTSTGSGLPIPHSCRSYGAYFNQLRSLRQTWRSYRSFDLCKRGRKCV